MKQSNEQVNKINRYFNISMCNFRTKVCTHIQIGYSRRSRANNFKSEHTELSWKMSGRKSRKSRADCAETVEITELSFFYGF